MGLSQGRCWRLGCVSDILKVMVLSVFTRSAIRQLPMFPYLGSLFLQTWSLFNSGGSFSVRTSDLNAAPVGELLAWGFEIGKVGWSGGPMRCVRQSWWPN